jgi:hypothetical protein
MREMNFDNLKTTAKEDAILRWCYDNLTDEQAADVEEEAIEIATTEVNAPEAAEDLLRTLVEVIVRNAQEQGELL